MKRRSLMVGKREQKGWTQEELAERSDCSRGLISNIERGYATPSLPIAISISHALESSVEDIFFDLNAQKVSRKGRKKKGEEANAQSGNERTGLEEITPVCGQDDDQARCQTCGA